MFSEISVIVPVVVLSFDQIPVPKPPVATPASVELVAGAHSYLSPPASDVGGS